MSTIKTITYNTSDQNVFAHDSSEILINGSGATLIPLPLQTDEMVAATGRVALDSDRAISGNISNYLRGTATHNTTVGYNFTDTTGGSYLTINDDTLRDGVTPLSDTAHFDFGTQGTIRMKVTFPYSGNPSSTNYLFTTGSSTVANGLGSLVTVYHSTSGAMQMIIRDSAGVATFSTNFGAFTPTSGQSYEIELSVDMVNAVSTGIFIDGVQLGAYANTLIAIAARDYFYVGTYYVNSASFKSQHSVKDIQIFSTVQHIADFAVEIPRAVELYPQESLITPAEFSVAEGFFGISQDVTVLGTGAVQYVLKVESALYYATGGVLVISDGSYAQSASVSTWNDPTVIAAITALITSGARITMLPIIYSGLDACCYNPLLVSTTVTYDFFALPVSCTSCTLYGFIKDNCNDIASGTVKVSTYKGAILTQGNLTSFEESDAVDTANSGFFELEVVIPNLPVVVGREDDLYLFEANWVDTDGKSWEYTRKVLIPNATSVLLTDVIVE